MRTIILFTIYILSFVLFFLMLSAIGMLWHPYSEVIKDTTWFFFYTLLLGSWMSIFPAREYYMHNEEYFDTVFG